MKTMDIIRELGTLSPKLIRAELKGHLSGRVQVDNRKVLSGDIFVCIRGFSSDGHKYAHLAVENGASLLIVLEEMDLDVAQIKVTDTRKAAALLARMQYMDPSASMKLIGITGTNGKTTTSLLIYQGLVASGAKCGWIGTLGYYLNNQLYQTAHTTPDIFDLNSILADMKASGCEYVVMEVSSHAISLDRIYGLSFDLALFSNLSREHLDFHRDMDDYFQAKYSFLRRTYLSGGRVIINGSDAWGQKAIEDLKRQNPDGKGSDRVQSYNLTNWKSEATGSELSLGYKDEELSFKSRLIGSFNVQNLALAAAALIQLGLPVGELAAIMEQLEPVKGRFQPVENDFGLTVVVDYAHSPDAIEKILKSCQELEHRRLYCLVGAGGDRDKGKRPLMLQAALHNSDAVIITDDNPRWENPEQIISDMLSGTDTWFPWWIIRDRQQAIEAIIRMACPGDIVVICGKGHENYQEIMGQRHHFDDYEVAHQYLSSKRYHAQKTDDELILPLDRLMLKLVRDQLYRGEETGWTQVETYRYISTDSRSIKPGSAFFAIRGERYDGNAYISSILEEPASMAIGNIDFESKSYEKTDDPLELMGDICRKYLMMFGAYKVALTGSTGKTGTKEIMAAILEEAGPTLKTLHNENNLVGICKTILRILPEHRYAVLELGTNHFGEIARLAEICQPDSGMILNIGPSHLEYLIDEDGVFKEKSSLFNRSLQYRLYPSGDLRFESYRKIGLSVGEQENADFQVADIRQEGEGMAFCLNQYSFTVPVPVPHMVSNASFAIALALCLGLERDLIQRGLSKPIKLEKRMEIKRIGKTILLVDCYNANPVSMQKGIEFWIGLEPKKPHRAILGDMLELGKETVMYHQMIGAMLAELDYDGLISVGELATNYEPEQKRMSYTAYHDVEELIEGEDLKAFCQGCVVLIKASHGIHLERLLPLLEGLD